MKYTYRNGSILDCSTQVLNLQTVSCSKKFRDRVGKTLVGILNAEERGNAIARSRASAKGEA